MGFLARRMIENEKGEIINEVEKRLKVLKVYSQSA